VPDPSLPEHFRGFARAAERDGGTTYAAICRGVADNAEVMALMDEAPLTQRRPNLLMAAVHFLLLRGAAHPLAVYYDTVGGSTGVAEGDVAAVFVDFCRAHHDELLALIGSRNTQTNEVGRCAALMPALALIAGDQPVSLLDLGCSAGLNLLFDHYGYRYRQRSDDTELWAGALGSSVTIECVSRGALRGLPALDLPAVRARVGLDLSPLYPTSSDTALWLQACLWPDNLPRFARLRSALEIARTTSDRPRLERGELVDDLDRVAATIDPADPLVVFHTWVAAYLTETRQRELVDAVRSLGESRPVHYLYAESPAETPGLPTPVSPEPRPTSNLATALVHIGPDGAAPVRLADLHPHGTWLRWWGA
jgi:hypothetical protein